MVKMEDGKVYTRGFRALLFIVINQSFVTANLLSCSRSLQTLGPRYSTHFSFSSFSFFPSPPPPLLSSFLSQQFARHRRRSWWKKRGGLNLKNVGQKDGNEVNALTKREKRKIYGNLVKRLPKLIRFFNE